MSTIARPAVADRLGDLVVPLRAARLDDRRDPRLERDLDAVREREERVRREHGALEIVAERTRLLDRERTASTRLV